MSFNIPQIVSVTSESLQAKIRSLLPSQQGFGADLQASNVIFPVVDLTAAAEGSTVGVNLQTSLAFGSQTAFDANNATVVIANSPGFYRIFGTSTIEANSTVDSGTTFSMSDGLSTKNVWKFTADASGDKLSYNTQFDFTVFLGSGESISAVSDSGGAFLQGSSRQIADVNGNLVNPVGFNPQ